MPALSPRLIIYAALVAGAIGLLAMVYLRGRGDEAIQHERAAVTQDNQNREIRSETDRRLLSDPAAAPRLRERWTRD